MTPRRVDALLEARWLSWAAMAWVALVATTVLLRAAPFGNDEAQYALGAHSLSGPAAGADVDTYPLFRPVGMRLLAAPGVIAGGHEDLVRAPFVAIALAYLALLAFAVRRWFGARAAGLAVLLQAGATPWLVRSTEALSDLPAAAMLLAMLVLITLDAERQRARPGAWVVVAGLGALVIHVRYGAVPIVASILAAAALTYPARRRELLCAGLGVLALLAPLLTWSQEQTGSPVGVFELAGVAANHEYAGEGLVYYLTRWPWALVGPLMGGICALGAVLGLRAWREGEAGDAAGRTRRLLVAVALAQVVILGLRAHGEARYVFLATTALASVGTAWLAGHAPRLRQATFVLALASLVVAAIIAHARVDRHRQVHGPLTEAARRIGEDAAGRRCLVFTGTQPQVAWYSGCRTSFVLRSPPDAALAAGFERVYLVSAAIAPRQPRSAAAMTSAGLAWDVLECTPRWCVWTARAQ